MAALTINSAGADSMVRVLEDVVITNQTANSTAVTKAVKVPDGAKRVTFWLFQHSSAGTTPLLDFVIGVPDFGSAAKMLAPTDDTDAALGNGAWNGITQVTGTGPYLHTIEIGSDVADDDTGSATATDTYGVKVSVLPPWLSYTYTTDGTTDDEDYSFCLIAKFQR